MLRRDAPSTLVSLAAAAALVVIAANVVQLRIIGAVADAIWSGRGYTSALVAIVLVAFVRMGLIVTTRLTGQRAASVPRLVMRRRIIEHLCRLGPAYLDKGTVGEVSYLATDGVEALEPYYALYLPQLFVGLIAPVGIAAYVALAVDRASGLVLLAVVPTVPLVLGLVGSRFKSVSRRYFASAQELTDRFVESIRALPLLSLFQAGELWGRAIRRDAESLRKRTMRLLAANQLVILLVDLMFSAVTVVATTMLALRGLAGGAFSPGTALFLVLLSVELVRPMSLLGSFFFAGALGRAARSRANAFFARRPQVPSDGEGVHAPVRSDIAFHEVSLRYTGADRAFELDRVSFAVEHGARVAITGASGSGKSTLLHLLQRWYAPLSGSIRVGGVDVRQMDHDSLRSLFATVSQHTHLFYGSLRDNLRIADPSADDDRLTRALAAAGLPASSLPEGLDTEVGENAARISGGQAQRIGIARALLADAPILLLDEPTAHLDPITEQELLPALVRAAQGRTTVLVSHTPDLLRIACCAVTVNPDGTVSPDRNVIDAGQGRRS